MVRIIYNMKPLILWNISGSTSINLPTSLGINSTFNSLSALSCDNLTGNFFPEGPEMKVGFEICAEYKFFLLMSLKFGL